MSMITRSERAHALAFALALAGATTLAPHAHAADEPTSAGADPLDPLRERFRVGFDQYRSGQYAEAIVTWEAIYRELGPEKGYRLAFNLARAYDAIGEGKAAAEHYDTYVAEVERRRAGGETLEANVERQE